MGVCWKRQPDSTAGADNKAQPVDLVVGVVNEHGSTIRAVEVANILRDRGHDISNNTVSNSLHYAAHRAKPQRIVSAEGRGQYAPLAVADADVFMQPPSTTPRQQAEEGGR